MSIIEYKSFDGTKYTHRASKRWNARTVTDGTGPAVVRAF